MTVPDPDKLRIDTTTPNAARIYDYTLGGTVNFEADRQAAEFMFQLIPSTRKWVRMLRAFLQEASRTLYDEGFTQFLDLASGLPTQDHIHAVVPEARVVYNDIDPLTVTYAQSLLADLDRVSYTEGDVRQIEAILRSDPVRKLLDLEDKVAIGFNGINVFLSQEETRHIAQTLHDWAPAGSKLFVTFETKNPDKMTPQFEQFLGMFAATGSPMTLHSLEDNVSWMKPWQVDRLEPLAEFLAMPDDYIVEEDREGVDLEFYGCIMSKDTG